jgi:hypothetical protein
MNWDEVSLVVKNADGLYFNGEDTWADVARAWHFQSAAAFVDAQHFGGKVYLRLPSGREIEVLPEDFNLKDF